ncbi:MAG: hypothetical protein Q4G09_05715 [Clostridia bacterium]|nr:hypothetical protein [Clostridia bacterium]
MQTMKKFFLYFIMLVALYLIVELLLYVCMRDNYKKATDYETTISETEISIFNTEDDLTKMSLLAGALLGGYAILP